MFAYGGEGTLALLATDLEFEGSRVKSPVTGRDFNPMGRGDGTYYAQGAFAIYEAKSEFVGEITSGFGNSVCNGEAVPTALDLGGSPVHGAHRDGAEECCRGASVRRGKDDTDDDCQRDELYVCVSRAASARDFRWQQRSDEFFGGYLVLQAARAVVNIFLSTPVVGVATLPDTQMGALGIFAEWVTRRGLGPFWCWIWHRDDPEEYARCIKNWNDALDKARKQQREKEMELYRAITEVRAFAHCALPILEDLAYIQWINDRNDIEQRYANDYNECVHRHCKNPSKHYISAYIVGPPPEPDTSKCYMPDDATFAAAGAWAVRNAIVYASIRLVGYVPFAVRGAWGLGVRVGKYLLKRWRL